MSLLLTTRQFITLLPRGAAVAGLVVTCACGSLAYPDQNNSVQGVETTAPNIIAHKISQPANLVSGSVSGNSLNAQSAVYVIDQEGSATYLVVMIADVADLCGLLSAGTLGKNVNTLGFTLSRSQPGAYSVLAAAAKNVSSYALAAFGHADATCEQTLSLNESEGESGSVQLDSLDEQAQGTFDILVGSQNERLHGTFAATACPALGTLVHNSDTFVCQ